eukprot:3196132-Rhodomonas_salina.2
MEERRERKGEDRRAVGREEAQRGDKVGWAERRRGWRWTLDVHRTTLDTGHWTLHATNRTLHTRKPLDADTRALSIAPHARWVRGGPAGKVTSAKKAEMKSAPKRCLRPPTTTCPLPQLAQP